MTLLFQILLTGTLVILTSHRSTATGLANKDTPVAQSQTLPDSSRYFYPEGDPRRCQEQARESNFGMERLGVLPGLGWDNLRNREMGVVVSYSYSLCKVTEDGQFLIPDNVAAVPVKSSYIEIFAELINNYVNATSSTSKSINADAGLSFKGVVASGAYSSEFKTIKEKQIAGKAVTTRVQLRYLRYDARLQPDPFMSLSPAFKKCLLRIAAHILLNNTALAAYEGELLVRDFGTHVLTSVIAGAGLEKVDFLQSKFLQGSSVSQKDILAEASASFFGTFNISLSYSNKYSSSSTVSNQYKSSTSHSYVRTHGGPLLVVQQSINDWTDKLNVNLVPMDRSGDPLYFLITEQLFPELPSALVASLEEVVRNSGETYYKFNTIKGCTKIDSPNFSQPANFEDGSCMAKATNMTFGGVFQTCTSVGNILHTDPCNGMTHYNPSTGSTSCPSSYQAVLMYSGSKIGDVETERICRRKGFWIFSHTKCDTKRYQATAYYKAYWCSAIGKVPNNSGHKFGDFYSSLTDNSFTKKHACPLLFRPVKILDDVYICLSESSTAPNLLPFGGFYSCQTGNPLANVDPKTGRISSQESQWPKRCPNDYSQHTMTVEQGCAISYCVQNLPGPVLPAVKRPPFSSVPASLIGEKDAIVTLHFDDEGPVDSKRFEEIALGQQDGTLMSLSEGGENAKEGYVLSKEAVAVLGAGVSLAMVVLIPTIIILSIKLRKKKKNDNSGIHLIEGNSHDIDGLRT